MHRREVGVLIVAPWGDPRGWDKVRYRVNLKLGSISVERVVKTGSSTVAIAAAAAEALERLKRVMESKGKGGEQCVDTRLKALIIAPHSLACGKTDVLEEDSIDKHVQDYVKEFLKKFAEECEVCDDESCERTSKCSIDTSFFDIVPVPAIGKFCGYEFKADPLLMFQTVFTRVYETARCISAKYLIFDATHGINYVTITSLYASVAAAALTPVAKNKTLESENRFVIVNSEPLPPKAKGGRQKGSGIREARNPRNVQELSILDLRELHKVITYVRAIKSLLSFGTEPFKEVVTDLKTSYTGDEIAKQVVDVAEKFYVVTKLLSLNMAALVAPQTNLESISIKKLQDEINTLVNTLRRIAPPKPRIKDKVVEYPHAKYAPHIVVAYSMKTIFDMLELDKLANAQDLLDYLSKVSSVYGNKLEDAREIVSHEKEMLKKIVDTYLANKYGQTQPAETTEKIPAHELEKVWKGTYGTKQYEAEKREDKELSLRNMSCHAGLAFTAVNEIEVQKKKHKILITKINYNKHKIQKLLNNLKLKTTH